MKAVPSQKAREASQVFVGVYHDAVGLRKPVKSITDSLIAHISHDMSGHFEHRKPVLSDSDIHTRLPFLILPCTWGVPAGLMMLRCYGHVEGSLIRWFNAAINRFLPQISPPIVTIPITRW